MQAKLAWRRAFLELPHGIPSHDTCRRVCLLLDPQQYAAVFLRWTQSLRAAVGAEVVALDGKTLRRSFAPAKGRGPLPLVSAWASANGLILGQIATAAKSNEITAVPELLRALELAGCPESFRDDGGRAQQPKDHRPRDQRGGCRLRAGAQSQPRHRRRRGEKLSG